MKKIGEAVDVGSIPYARGTDGDSNLIVEIVPTDRKALVSITAYKPNGEYFGDSIMVSRVTLTRFIALMQKAHAKISALEAHAAAQVGH